MSCEVEIVVRGCLPSKMSPNVRRKLKRRRENVDALVKRFENGVDLWEAKPLQKHDAYDRDRCLAERQEKQMKEEEVDRFLRSLPNSML